MLARDLSQLEPLAGGYGELGARALEARVLRAFVPSGQMIGAIAMPYRDMLLSSSSRASGLPREMGLATLRPTLQVLQHSIPTLPFNVL